MPCYSHDTLKLHFESLGNHCKLSRFVLVMIGTIIFSPGPFYASTSSTYPPDFNAKLTAMEHILKVLSYHGQIDAQISTNSGQIRPEDPQEHKEKLQVPCYSKFSRKEMITSFTWHEMRQFQQPHHYTVCQWGFYPIVKTCKKWVMTLSSSMAMYSVMRDIYLMQERYQ